MRIKNLAPMIIVILVFLVLNSSAGYCYNNDTYNDSKLLYQALPICKKTGFSCSGDMDCCPVYFTESGVFYGKCIDYKCRPINGIDSNMNKLDLCKEIYNTDGTIRNQDLWSYYVLYYSNFLGWDSGIPLAQQYYNQGLTDHVCDLIFPEDIPTTPTSGQFNYKYDIHGNLISIAPPSGSLEYEDEQERNYYDLLHSNRPYATKSADKGLTKVYYNGLGNVIKTIDSKRTRIFTEYDEYHRVKRIYSLTDPTVNVEYFYGNTASTEDCQNTQHANNKICNVVDNSGYTLYEYDERGRINRETRYTNLRDSEYKIYPVEYEYDSADNINTVKYGDTEITYYRNSLNQIDKVAFTKGTFYFEPIVNYTYNPSGTISSKNMGLLNLYQSNPEKLLFTDFSYNPRDWLTSIYASKGSSYNQGSEIFKRTQDYDPTGNVISISNYIDFGDLGNPPPNPGSVFNYDPLNRLKSEGYDSSIINPPIAINYTYDIVGNREELQKLNNIASPPSNVVAFYHFYEGRGDTIRDISVYENHGIRHGATWTTGINGNGNALEFDGSDDYVEIPHSNSLDLTQLTISLWIKTPSSLSDGWHNLVSKQGADRDYSLYVYRTGGKVDRLHFSSARFGSSVVMLPKPYKPETWHHVAVSVNSTGFQSYYSDGMLIGTYQGTPGNANNNYPLWIGRADNYWNGIIDQVVIYNYAVDFIPTTGNLVAEWHMNENGGNVIQDSSGNENRGYLMNLGKAGDYGCYPWYNTPNFPYPQAKWLWKTPLANESAPVEEFWVQKSFFVSSSPVNIYLTADNYYELYINNNLIGSNDNWTDTETYNVDLPIGKNNLKMKVGNAAGGPVNPAGFIVAITDPAGGLTYTQDDGTWWSNYSWVSPGYDGTGSALHFNGGCEGDAGGCLGAGSPGYVNHVRVPHSQSLNPTDQITVDAWVKFDNFNATTGWILDAGGIVGKAGFAYYLHTSRAPSYGSSLFFTLWNGTGHSIAYGLNNLNNIEPGKWYHVVGTYDKKVQMLFVDNELVGKIYHTDPIRSTTGDVILGRWADYGWVLNGTIDDVKIYNYAKAFDPPIYEEPHGSELYDYIYYNNRLMKIA